MKGGAKKLKKEQKNENPDGTDDGSNKLATPLEEAQKS